MISVLMQERLLGAALGSIFAGVAVFEQRKSVYSLISENQSPSTAQLQVREHVLERESRSQIAPVWNKAVDWTFIPSLFHWTCLLNGCYPFGTYCNTLFVLGALHQKWSMKGSAKRLHVLQPQ